MDFGKEETGSRKTEGHEDTWDDQSLHVSSTFCTFLFWDLIPQASPSYPNVLCAVRFDFEATGTNVSITELKKKDLFTC